MIELSVYFSIIAAIPGFKMQKKLEEAGCLHATINPAIRGLRLRMSTKLPPAARSADAKKNRRSGFFYSMSKPNAQNWFMVLSLPAAFSAASPLK